MRSRERMFYTNIRSPVKGCPTLASSEAAPNGRSDEGGGAEGDPDHVRLDAGAAGIATRGCKRCVLHDLRCGLADPQRGELLHARSVLPSRRSTHTAFPPGTNAGSVRPRLS